MTSESGSDAGGSRVGRGRDPRVVRTADGDRIAYAEYGDPDGAPAVFLHGTPGSRLLGAVLDDAARRNGVRVLAPDRPGYGRSTPRPGRSPSDAASFVAPVLDDAGVSRAGAVGFSGGGAYALALAATRDDLVADVDVIAGAVPPSLAGDAPRVQRALETLARRSPALLRGLMRGQAWVAGRVRPSFVLSQYTTADCRAEIPDDTAELVARDFVEAFARTGAGFVTESRLLAEEWEFSLGSVGSSVRLWHGERDANVPVLGARRVADALPDAELTVFDDADHLTTLLRSSGPVLERHGSVGTES